MISGTTALHQRCQDSPETCFRMIQGDRAQRHSIVRSNNANVSFWTDSALLAVRICAAREGADTDPCQAGMRCEDAG
jgi:hypothetical protein